MGTVIEIRFQAVVDTTTNLNTDRYPGRMGFDTTKSRFVVSYDGTNWAENARRDVPETFASSVTAASLFANDLTSGQVATIGASGRVRGDAGLTYTLNGSVVDSIGVGNGTTAAFVKVNAFSGGNSSVYLQNSGFNRWGMIRVATSNSWWLRAYDAAGAAIDNPLDVANGSGGTITIGGSTNRPVNFTGDIQFGGTTRFTVGGAVTATSATVTGLTSGRVVYVGSGSVLSDSQYFTVDTAGGSYFFGGSQAIGTYPGRGIALVTVGSSYRSPRIELFEASAQASWSVESYYGKLRFVSGYNTTPVTLATFDTAGIFTVGDGTGNARLRINNASGNSNGLNFQMAGVNRWFTGYDANAVWIVEAANASGTVIDQPVSIVNASGGLITLGGSTGRPVNFTGDIRLGGTTRFTVGGAVTATSATVTGLTSGRIVRVGASGQLVDDAGLTAVQSGGVTVTIIVGDGVTASNAAAAIRAPAGRKKIFSLQTGTTDRWTFMADDTAESGSNAGSPLRGSAYTDGGAWIDDWLYIVRAAGGSITLGGVTARPTNFTGALQIGGSQFLSTGKALVVTSAQVTALAGTGVRAVTVDASGSLVASTATGAVTVSGKSYVSTLTSTSTLIMQPSVGVLGSGNSAVDFMLRVYNLTGGTASIRLVVGATDNTYSLVNGGTLIIKTGGAAPNGSPYITNLEVNNNGTQTIDVSTAAMSNGTTFSVYASSTSSVGTLWSNARVITTRDA